MSAMRRYVNLVAGLWFAALVCAPSTTWAQSAPPLGTVTSFGVLGGSGVTAAGGVGTVIDGDVGSAPTPTVTGFGPAVVTPGHTVYTAANATTASARTDAGTAYGNLAGQACTSNVVGGLLGGLDIGPGVYCMPTGSLTGTLTLTGTASDVWVFKITLDTLTTAGASVIQMAGTASACNVYWQVTSSATLGSASTFRGNIFAGVSIGLGTTANVIGRAVAGSGAVTMDGVNTVGGCSAAAAAPTVTKAFNPTSITAGGVSRLTITLNNPNAAASALSAAFVDNLPAGVLVSAAPNPTTTCGGTATATAGGSSVTLSQAGSSIPSSGSCTVAVNVTAAAPGSFINTIPAGALQTTGGNNTAPATATLTATCPTVTVGPATLPAGRVGVAYSQQLSASGGTGPYVFSVSSGTLPAGLTLSASGLLSGTPTTVGSSTVTIQAADANSCAGPLVYTIVVAAATCPVITVGPATLPPGRVGVAYSQQLSASGGTSPYVFSVLSGTLPTGLTLSSSGLLSGTPTTLGSTPVTIQATDASGCPGVIAYTIVIAAATCPVITLAPAALPSGRVAVAYSRQLSASGGTGPYVFSVLSGALPAGLTLSSGGLLSGTPTTVGSTPVTLQVTDASGCPDVNTYTIVIAAATCPVITLAPATLPSGAVGIAYSQQLTASGGTGPYIFSVLSGALPVGLTLSSGGLLSGRPTTVGSSPVTLQVTDASGCPDVNTYTIVIAAAVPTLPQFFVVVLALGLMGVGYVQLRRARAR